MSSLFERDRRTGPLWLSAEQPAQQQERLQKEGPVAVALLREAVLNRLAGSFPDGAQESMTRWLAEELDRDLVFRCYQEDATFLSIIEDVERRLEIAVLLKTEASAVFVDDDVQIDTEEEHVLGRPFRLVDRDLRLDADSAFFPYGLATTIIRLRGSAMQLLAASGGDWLALREQVRLYFVEMITQEETEEGAPNRFAGMEELIDQLFDPDMMDALSKQLQCSTEG